LTDAQFLAVRRAADGDWELDEQTSRATWLAERIERGNAYR
jgi:hypothetical protein